MQKLIYIDACMRDQESRTRRIAEPIVAELAKKYDIEEICLDGPDWQAVGRDVLKERSQGYVKEETVAMAKRIAQAERIVIAAPFWDMSFPAVLKVFFENMSLFNVTFRQADSTFEGLCSCEKVLYITSRGMNVSTGDPLEQATPYIKALGALWGLGELITVAAQNMDFSTPEEIDRKVIEAVAEGLRIVEMF